jgi:hypothetical protein
VIGEVAGEPWAFVAISPKIEHEGWSPSWERQRRIVLSAKRRKTHSKTILKVSACDCE